MPAIIPAYLIAALISVESAGNDQAIRHNANGTAEYGCLQIAKRTVDDVNRIVGMNVYTYTDTFDRSKSIAMAKIYLGHYATERRLGHKPDEEDYARIWNGGPNGYKKPSTLAYWGKVGDAWRHANGFR